MEGQVKKECEQYVKSFEYIENNTITKDFFKIKEVKIVVDTNVQEWSGIVFLFEEYYSYKMNISVEQFNSLDRNIKDKIYWENQDKLLKIDTTYSINCFEIKDYLRPNIEVSFTWIENNTLGVWIRKMKRNPKKHSFGKYLIMFFDKENNIEKVLESNWLE